MQQRYAVQNASQSSPADWYWKFADIDGNVRIVTFEFVCTFDDTHHLDYVVITDNTQMVKIGQFPSVADIDFPQLKQYQKVVSKQDMRELKRAIGLHAQGIGIGSFVYIRRIFERLVDKAKELAIEDAAITIEDYESKNGIVEKIKLLTGYLPDILTKNTVVYGIVSKGIHELSEEDCLTYFPVMKEFTIMILDQWNQERKRKEAEQKISSAISNIATKIN